MKRVQRLEQAEKVIQHYADYKTWPGDNPKVNREEWAKWYEGGGYHGFDRARAYLMSEGETNELPKM